jgi:hypothetical protein
MDTVRDAEAFEAGVTLAEAHMIGKKPAADDDAILEFLYEVEAGAVITGWAEAACLRGYRRTYR